MDNRDLWLSDMGLDPALETPEEGPAGPQADALPPFLAAVQAQVADMQARVDQALDQLTPAARPDWRDLLSPRHQVMLQAAVQLDTQFQAAGWPGQGQAALIRSMADILDGLV